MLTFKSSFLISQVVSAMVALIQNSSEFDVATWAPQKESDGTFSCDALIDCPVRLKGFEESHGIDRVIVRFDVVVNDCTFNEKEMVYEGDHTLASIWGGGCDHNLTFQNDEGGTLHTYGIGGFLEKFDNQNDEDITAKIIDQVFATLSTDEKNKFLKDIFRTYNKKYKEWSSKSDANKQAA